MKRIAVMTSGGDAPGMNAAVRAIVRAGIHQEILVYGIHRGYAGMIGGDIEEMDLRSVGGIIHLGGTILLTARCPEFMTEKGQIEGLRQLRRESIDGLIVIGGNGSLAGALVLHQMGIKVVGVPGSIDNDLARTDMSIGVDSALNTALYAIDKLKDTASSHGRAFIIEVMGRHCGWLALEAGIAGGAEMVLIPEQEVSLEEVAREIKDSYMRGKAHAVIVVAEGARYNAQAVAEYLTHEQVGFEVRVTTLGHIQRGGSPTAYDRILATRLGVAAVDTLREGKSGVMVGQQGRTVVATPLEEVLEAQRPLNPFTLRMAEILAR
ncbi:MAG: 6-phosphofructokinase [Chloroflexi bacterium]|nr:6-phosphofructokinase [Chloroflexota bacterium]MBU1751751.1 6-phosphofructokinase [Chloroflexota bacterium]